LVVSLDVQRATVFESVDPEEYLEERAEHVYIADAGTRVAFRVEEALDRRAGFEWCKSEERVGCCCGVPAEQAEGVQAVLSGALAPCLPTVMFEKK
jgi:hypothetical protein